MRAERSYDVESALVEEDLVFQRRQWTVQRAGWWIVVAVPIAALLGFCGGGIVSARTQNADGTHIEYQRFSRRLGSTDLRVTVHDAAPNADTIVLRIDRRYLDTMRPATYLPPPRRIESTDQYSDFVFARAPGALPAVIEIEMHPKVWGKAVGALRVNGGAPVVLHAFVWP